MERADMLERLKELECEKCELEEQNESEAFDAYLDEQGDVVIGTFRCQPSAVLKTIDPKAYGYGLADSNDERLNAITQKIEKLRVEHVISRAISQIA